MPLLGTRDRSSSRSWDKSDSASDSEPLGIDPLEYPALSFPGYSEKPLNEQLEPIAVIGMGKYELGLKIYTETDGGNRLPLTW